VVPIALSAWDLYAPVGVRELRELAAAVADYLVLERDLADGSPRLPGYAADLATLDQLRLRIERLVLGGVSAPAPEPDLIPDLVPALVAPAPSSVVPEIEPPGWLADESRYSTGPFFGPALELAARMGTGHGVAWLPDRPQVNAEPFELYLPTTREPRHSVADGVPSPHLFLIGHTNLGRMTGGSLEVSAPRYLLRVRVEPGGAVDVAASPPAELRALLGSAGAYLLPAGWLHRCRVLSGLRVDATGGTTPDGDFPSPPLLMYCSGARHGAQGMPNEVVRWPRSRLRATAARYVVIPDASAGPVTDQLVLYGHKPPVRPGSRLVEVTVGRRRAIDVAATYRRLVGLASVRSGLAELSAAGVDYVLPMRSYPGVMARRIYRPVGQSWRPLPGGRAMPLSALLGSAPANPA
jgi:hypothetical protein